MSTAKSIKVPKGWEGVFDTLTRLTDRVCDEHLDREYAELARYAIAALCRKRPSPLSSGQPQTWACAVLYALGHVNFLSDRASAPYMAMADLCSHFGVAASTGGNKAKLVRTALAVHQLDHNWMLPSRLENSSLPWLIALDGMIVDARRLPITMQAAVVQKGLIPYVCQDASQSRIKMD